MKSGTQSKHDYSFRDEAAARPGRVREYGKRRKS